MRTPQQFSPYVLIQEELCDQPWRLLIACMMLNLTSIKQVRPVINEFFSLYPTEIEASHADEKELALLLKPLGLYNRRAKMIIKFSKAYRENWTDIKKLPGIGKYAADSYMMFVEENLDVEPSDSKLKVYKEWAVERKYETRNEVCEAP